MKIACAILALALILGACLYGADQHLRGVRRDKEIRVLREEVNTLRLLTANPGRFLVYDATRVGAVGPIKY